jgi:hypothetical protein
MRSLQGQHDTIEKCCSRWASYLEQVKNNPPIGETIDNFVSYFFVEHFISIQIILECNANSLFICNVCMLDRIAEQRHKDMKASENRFLHSDIVQKL